MEETHANRGIYFIAIGWPLSVVVLFVVGARFYSRYFLTRSLGSDDFFILVSSVRGPNKEQLMVVCPNTA